MFTAFVLLGHFLRRKKRARQFLLTISGKHSEIFEGDIDQLTGAVEEIVGPLTVQNLGVDDGDLRYRISITPQVGDIGALVEKLQSKLPGFQVSYANLENLL